MICSGKLCSQPNFLEQLNTATLNDSFFQSFLNDILFWEQETTDLWARPYGSKKRRKPRETITGERSNVATSRQNTGDDEIDEITINALSHSNWKSAIDPRTGKTYYYHSKTRVTQWKKPAEVKALEKKIRQEKRRQDAEFFREMEKNLHRSIGRGELIPGIAMEETTNKLPARKGTKILSQPRHVRTISRMGANINFEELGDDRRAPSIVRKPSTHIGPLHLQTSLVTQPPRPDRSGKPPLPKMTSEGSTNSMELSPEEQRPETHKTVSRVDSGVSLVGESLIDAPQQSTYHISELNMPSTMQAQKHARRNTSGTIFVENTMTRPDIQATIKCVCGVYRRHILQGIEHHATNRKAQYDSGLNVDIFQDYRIPHSHRHLQERMKAPALSEVLSFYKEFFLRSKMEHDTIIMSLIYVERLVKATDGALNPKPGNWRSILFACMVLASKVWDDLSMWNVDFSNVSTNTDGLFSFSLRRINELELHLLKSLRFDVRVGASEYAKYYFLIRSMLIRSGLVEESERPLRKTEAFQKLEAKTNIYQANQLNTVDQKDRRSKSMDDNFWRSIGTNTRSPGPVFSDSVCLEQIIGSSS